ncbi:MAG: hypothetical protein AAF997_24805, partial [Myxococcota bacterium]
GLVVGVLVLEFEENDAFDHGESWIPTVRQAIPARWGTAAPNMNASSESASMFGAAVPHLAGIACRTVGIQDSP